MAKSHEKPDDLNVNKNQPPQQPSQEAPKPWEDDEETEQNKQSDAELEEQIDKENQQREGEETLGMKAKRDQALAKEFADQLKPGQRWLHPGGDVLMITKEEGGKLYWGFVDQNNNFLEEEGMEPSWSPRLNMAVQMLGVDGKNEYTLEEDVAVQELQKEAEKEPERIRLKKAKLKVSGKTLPIEPGQELFGKFGTSITFVDIYKEGDETIIEFDFDNGKTKKPEELDGDADSVAALIQKYSLFSSSPEKKITTKKKEVRKETPYNFLGTKYTTGTPIAKNSEQGKLLQEVFKKKYPKPEQFTFAGAIKNKKSPGFWIKDEAGNNIPISSEFLGKVIKRLEEVEKNKKESAERLKTLSFEATGKRTFTLRKENIFNLGKGKTRVRVERILDDNKGAVCTIISADNKVLIPTKEYSRENLITMFGNHPDAKKETGPYRSSSPEVERLKPEELAAIRKVLLDPKNLDVVTHGDVYRLNEWADIKSARDVLGKTIVGDATIEVEKIVNGKKVKEKRVIPGQFLVKEIDAKTGEVVLIDRTTNKEVRYPNDHAFVQGLITLRPETDLDAKVTIDLLSKVTDNKFSQVAFVQKGETLEKAMGLHPDKNVIVFDTSGEHGIRVTKRENGTFVIVVDHHGKDLKKPTSVTKMFSELLKKLDLIEGSKNLRSISNFVTDIDNLNYPLNRDYIENYWPETLYGLAHKANPKSLPYWFIKEQFDAGRDPLVPYSLKEAKGLFLQKQNAEGKQILIRSSEEARSFGLVELKKHRDKVELLFDLRRQRREQPKGSEPRKKLTERIKKLEEYLKENYTLEDAMRETRMRTIRSLKRGIPDAEAKMKEHKMKNQTPELGKVLVNLIPKNYNTIPGDFPTVAAMGYNSYITMRENTGAIFLSSNFNKTEGVKKVAALIQGALPGLVVIRGLMIGYFPKRWEDRNTDFNKILQLLKIGGEAFPPKVEKEGEVRDRLTPDRIRSSLVEGATVFENNKTLLITKTDEVGVTFINNSTLTWTALERRAGKTGPDEGVYLIKKTGGAKTEKPAAKAESTRTEVAVAENEITTVLKNGASIIINGEEFKISSEPDADGIKVNDDKKTIAWIGVARLAKQGKLKLVKTS